MPWYSPKARTTLQVSRMGQQSVVLRFAEYPGTQRLHLPRKVIEIGVAAGEDHPDALQAVE